MNLHGILHSFIISYAMLLQIQRSSHFQYLAIHHFLTMQKQSSRVFLGKDVLKICSKFAGKHPCRSVISIKLQSKFIEITLRCGCSPVNLLHIFRTPFPKNISERLLLTIFLLGRRYK